MKDTNRNDPPPAPCLRLWRERGDVKLQDPLWRAACWEAAALEAQRPSQRQACLERARDIIAAARAA